jgi:hypothetical protein
VYESDEMIEGRNIGRSEAFLYDAVLHFTETLTAEHYHLMDTFLLQLEVLA